MPSYETVYPPFNPRPPNVVGSSITCRVNPALVYESTKLSDYFVPPGAMIFAPVRNSNSALKSNQTRAAAVSRKRRGEDCLDVVANAYGASETRTLKCDLRFVGIAIEGISAPQDAKRHPDSCGRFAVQVYGDVSIVASSKDIANMCIGDKLFATQTDNGLIYNGFPRDWSTFGLTTGGASEPGTKARTIREVALIVKDPRFPEEYHEPTPMEYALYFSKHFSDEDEKKRCDKYVHAGIKATSPIWYSISAYAKRAMKFTSTKDGYTLENGLPQQGEFSVYEYDPVTALKSMKEGYNSPEKIDNIILQTTKPDNPTNALLWRAARGMLSTEEIFRMVCNTPQNQDIPKTMERFLKTIQPDTHMNPYPLQFTLALITGGVLEAEREEVRDEDPVNQEAFNVLKALVLTSFTPPPSTTVLDSIQQIKDEPVTKASEQAMTKLTRDVIRGLTSSPHRFDPSPIGILLEANVLSNEARIKLM